MPVDMVRDAAVGVLVRVFEDGAYLSLALDRTLQRKSVSERGRRFLTQLVYGTVRHKLLCDSVLERLVRDPFEQLPPPIRAILRMGVFQALFCGQVTFPAMVHTSVDLAKRHGHVGLARLANAVLRRVPESLEAVELPGREQDPAGYLSVRYSMPRWLVDEWRARQGDAGAEDLCRASNTEAAPTLRTNTLRTTTEALLATLREQGVAAEQRTPIPEEITLIEGSPPSRSKLFTRGLFLIQDAASMLPSHLLEPRPGERVLDLCAAPGGKTTHLAQLAGGEALVVAMDLHANRLRLVRENVQRLDTPGIVLTCGDGSRPPLIPAFDRVLVDAPCTGLGTLRRRPDLKWRVTPRMRDELVVVQTALLRAGIGLCKNGGLIVYSVCTITPEETQGVARAALQTENVAPEDGPAWMNRWKTDPGQYQTSPVDAGLDGFYLMRLRKGS